MPDATIQTETIMKNFKLAAKQVATIKGLAADHATLEAGLSNHRAQAFIDLTEMFHKSKVDMATFKTAIATGCEWYYGKPNAETRKAKLKEAPQLIKDWSGRIAQSVEAGIKPTTVSGMTEGEVRQELAIVKATKADGVTRAKVMKEAGGAKATLATITKAAKKLTAKADPDSAHKLKERKAVMALQESIQAHLKSLDGWDARLDYLELMVGFAKSKPIQDHMVETLAAAMKKAS